MRYVFILVGVFKLKNNTITNYLPLVAKNEP